MNFGDYGIINSNNNARIAYHFELVDSTSALLQRRMKQNEKEEVVEQQQEVEPKNNEAKLQKQFFPIRPLVPSLYLSPPFLRLPLPLPFYIHVDLTFLFTVCSIGILKA